MEVVVFGLGNVKKGFAHVHHTHTHVHTNSRCYYVLLFHNVEDDDDYDDRDDF